MRVCISTFVNVVVLYRIRSGQSQNGIYDTRDRDKPYKDSAQLYAANKYRLRYVGIIYRLRHGCGRNGVSQAIVVKLRYGGYDLTEYGSA